MDGPYGGGLSSDTFRRGGELRRPDVRSSNILRQGRPMDGSYGGGLLLDAPVGAVHRAALTSVLRISYVRAARWTAPTGEVCHRTLP